MLASYKKIVQIEVIQNNLDRLVIINSFDLQINFQDNLKVKRDFLADYILQQIRKEREALRIK